MHFGRKKTLMDRAHDYVDQISEVVIPQLEAAWDTTVDKAGPVISDARDKAGPALAEARGKAAPMLAEGKAIAMEKASVGAALAAQKAAEGRDLAAAKVSELRAEPEPKGGKLKKILLFGGLLAIAGFVFTKLKGPKESANWQSSYVPAPPPAPKAPVSPSAPGAGAAEDVVATDDIGGGSPGEAISDSVEEPQEATTPDRPADVIDIDDVPEGTKS